jgi:hypothetical protein
MSPLSQSSRLRARLTKASTTFQPAAAPSGLPPGLLAAVTLRLLPGADQRSISSFGFGLTGG